jgi:hypothetical protein
LTGVRPSGAASRSSPTATASRAGSSASLARPLPGAREAVAAAAASGKRVIAVSRGEVPGALYLFGAAIEAVVTELDPDQLGVPPKKILYVSASAARRAEAVLRGMRAVAPRGVAGALALSSELEPVAA